MWLSPGFPFSGHDRDESPRVLISIFLRSPAFLLFFLKTLRRRRFLMHGTRAMLPAVIECMAIIAWIHPSLYSSLFARFSVTVMAGTARALTFDCPGRFGLVHYRFSFQKLFPCVTLREGWPIPNTTTVPTKRARAISCCQVASQPHHSFLSTLQSGCNPVPTGPHDQAK